MARHGAFVALWCVVAVAVQAVLGGCESPSVLSGTSGWTADEPAAGVTRASYDPSRDTFYDQARPLVFDVGPSEKPGPTGTLVVNTPTRLVYDGRVYYHPHTGYSLYSSNGKWLQRVVNHLGDNDERPARVKLAPGRYIVRPVARSAARSEFVVVIEENRTTRVDVEQLVASAR